MDLALAYPQVSPTARESCRFVNLQNQGLPCFLSTLITPLCSYKYSPVADLAL
jgi:hypothetical protein